MTSTALLTAIGWGGSALVVLSLLQTRVRRLRWLNLTGAVVLAGYNLALAVWPMVALNVVVAVVNAVQLVRLLGSRRDERTYQVVPVVADDAFLSDLVRTHRADTTRGAADLDGPRTGDLAAVVLDGDRVVGVLVAQQHHRLTADQPAVDR